MVLVLEEHFVQKVNVPLLSSYPAHARIPGSARHEGREALLGVVSVDRLCWERPPKLLQDHADQDR